MTYNTVNKPLTRCRVDELLDYTTNNREVDENTPGLDTIQRDDIRALKELLLYKSKYEKDDGYTPTFGYNPEDERPEVLALELTPEPLRE